ncbi:MAG: ATP-dependent sacrificial sulfur transferase LarE [Actinomycetota bacterium]
MTQSDGVGVTEVGSKLEDLRAWFAPLSRVVVAYSGGADSTLVAAVAAAAIGERALAVTAISPSLPPGELSEARQVAHLIGVRHRLVRTRETGRAEYLANGPDRCYHCRIDVYGVLAGIAEEAGGAVVVSGTNVDDLRDHRPGLLAAEERGVRHPLAETGFSKADVREAGCMLGLPTWNKPSSACLSSRIPYGVRITVDDLRRIGRAERLLKELGFLQCRVRVHNEIARIEVELEDIPRLAEGPIRDQILEGLRGLGFRYVALDLEGYRSGSMNPEGAP